VIGFNKLYTGFKRVILIILHENKLRYDWNAIKFDNLIKETQQFFVQLNIEYLMT
jgi:hypothetical protein